eukprot:gene8410-biopygen15162
MGAGGGFFPWANDLDRLLVSTRCAWFFLAAYGGNDILNPWVGSPGTMADRSVAGPWPLEGNHRNMAHRDARLEADSEPNCTPLAALDISQCDLAKYDSSLF